MPSRLGDREGVDGLLEEDAGGAIERGDGAGGGAGGGWEGDGEVVLGGEEGSGLWVCAEESAIGDVDGGGGAAVDEVVIGRGEGGGGFKDGGGRGVEEEEEGKGSHVQLSMPILCCHWIDFPVLEAQSV